MLLLLNTKVCIMIEVNTSVLNYLLPDIYTISPSPPGGEWWLRCPFFSYPCPYGFLNSILMDTVALVLLSKLYLIWNLFRNIELIKPVPIPKSHDIIKTTIFFTLTPLIHASTWSRFIRLKFPVQGYIIYVVSNMYIYYGMLYMCVPTKICGNIFHPQAVELSHQHFFLFMINILSPIKHILIYYGNNIIQW